MKTSMKKVLSFALAGALALTSVFSASTADASNAKKAGAVKEAKLSITAAKDKAVNGSVVVSGVAITTKSALTCKYDAKFATSIASASASAVAASGDAIKVTVTATKGALTCTDAAVSVLANNAEIAKVLVSVKGFVKEKGTAATKSIKLAKKKVVVAAGKNVKVKYTVKKVATATSPEAVTVKSANNKVAKASLVEGKNKIKIAVPKKAVAGASTKVTVMSGAKKAVVKVFVKNPAKKVKAKKATVVIKKNKTKKITLTVKAKNNKKATTDAVKVTASNKKAVKVKSAVAKKGKVVITVKAKKAGSSKLNVKVGAKKATVKVKVK